MIVVQFSFDARAVTRAFQQATAAFRRLASTIALWHQRRRLVHALRAVLDAKRDAL